MRLYEITNNFKELSEMAFNNDIDEQTFKDTMESLEYDLKEKADNYAKLIKSIDVYTEGYKKEENRLKKRRNILENRASKLKNNLESAMIESNNIKFNTDLFGFSIQNNPSRMVIDTIDYIPIIYYKKQEPQIDNEELKKAIKNGLEIKGVNLISTKSLRIK